MWQMLWPVLVVVGANTIYHISAKSAPENIDLFASLTLTYVIAGFVSLAMFFLTGAQKNLLQEMAKANWATYALAATIVFLEFGYLMVYRVGWPVSTASLVSNMVVCIILLLIGILFYKEAITAKQMLGIFVCFAGLFLVRK